MSAMEVTRALTAFWQNGVEFTTVNTVNVNSGNSCTSYVVRRQALARPHRLLCTAKGRLLTFTGHPPLLCLERYRSSLPNANSPLFQHP